MPRRVFASPVAFYGGVSQQPETLRLSTKGRLQDNAWSSLVDIMGKRPPSEFMAPVFLNSERPQGGGFLEHTIDRGEGERSVLLFSNNDIRAFDAENKKPIPVIAKAQARITFLSVPIQDPIGLTDPGVTLDTLSGPAKTFLFHVTAGFPADADPLYYVNTTINNTPELVAIALVAKMRTIITSFALNATVYSSGNVVSVFDNAYGENTSLVVKYDGTDLGVDVDGDAANSIDVLNGKFLYTRTSSPQAIQLRTQEGLGFHDPALVLEAPNAGGPAAFPWKSFGTATAVEYNDVLMQTGPYGGPTEASLIRAVRGVGNQDAMWYYRPVITGEPTSLIENFVPTGEFQIVSVYVQQWTSFPTNAIEIGWYNSTDSSWSGRVKFDFPSSGTVLSPTPTVLAGALNTFGFFEDLGFGVYRIGCAYRSQLTDAGDKRRPALFMNMPLSEAPDKRMLATSFMIENSVDRIEPSRFYYKPAEAGRAATIGQTTFFLNRLTTTQMDSSTRSPAKVGDEAYFWVREVNYDANYLIRMRSGTAKLKTAAAVGTTAVTAPAANPTQTFGHNLCVGFNADSAGAAGTQALCELTAAVDDPDKGVWILGSGNVVGSGVRTPIASTDDVARYLRNELGGAGKAYAAITLLDAGATAERNGEVVRAIMPTTSPQKLFDEIKVSDSFGGDGLTKVHKTVESKLDLPPMAKEGFKVKVEGDSDSDIDDTFVVAIKDGNSESATIAPWGPVKWEETIDYNVLLRFDPTTMPAQLVLKRDDAAGTVTNAAFGTPTPNAKYFDYTVAPWTDRVVGNDALNKQPSFIGRKLRDITIVKERLTLLSDQTLVMSRANDPYQMWRTTTLRVEKDDRIDIIPSDVAMTAFHHAVVFDDKVTLFSKLSRFLIQGSPMTAENISSQVSERVQNFEFVPPVPMASSIFYGHKQGDFSEVMECFPSEEATTNESKTATDDVPAFIEGDILWMAGSTLNSVLAVGAKSSPQHVYIFKFAGQGDQRSMEAWFRYDLGDGSSVLAGGWVENDLILTVLRNYDVGLERIKFSDRQTDTGKNWQFLADRRINENTLGFSRAFGGTNTTFTLPYRLDIKTSDGVVAVDRDTAQLLTVIGDAGTTVIGGKTVSTVVVAGDQTLTKFYLGQPYKMRYEFTRPVLRETHGRGEVAVVAGRLGLEQGYLSYHGAADASFNIKITTLAQGEVTAGTFDALKLTHFEKQEGGGNGNIDLFSGRLQFGVNARADECLIAIENTSPFPAYFSKCEFEGIYEEAASRG